MIVTSILEPHKVLNEIVDDRTRRLEQSEQEIIFYLDMWTHKIGNILQGVMTYLEIISENSEDSDMSVQNELAKDLGREGNIVNRQVITLANIKQTKEKTLELVNLKAALMIASEDMQSYSTKGIPSIDIRVDSEVFVKADTLLDQLFMNLFVHISKKQDVENLKMVINSESLNDSVIIKKLDTEG
jgi:light-regulated signal transduction histidine kinase (bacteriophytochrome)